MNKHHVSPCYFERALAAIKSTVGETLVETLISTLIVSAVVLMLSTAIVTAARVNAKAAEVNTTFDENLATSENSNQYVLKIGEKNVSTSGTSPKVKVYEQNGYVFYRYGGK